MLTRKLITRAALAGALLMCVPAFVGVAQATSEVPVDWNVDPVAGGAYLQSFDSEISPTWTTEGSTNTVTFPSLSGANFAARSNEWFTANVRVLELNTKGTVLTNAVAYAGPATVSFATKPVYVDMKVFFEVAEQAPSTDLLGDAKVAVYASNEASPKLVVVHNAGSYTNAATLNTNLWHQLTIKLHANTVDVLLADDAIVTGLTPRNYAQNELKSVNFYGTGFVDELYVSHGSPARTTTTAVPALPEDVTFTEAEKETLLQWVSVNPDMNVDVVFTNTLTLAQLGDAFLLNELTVVNDEITPTAYTFGVSKIARVSPTQIAVTLKLTVNTADKVGTINGKIQLQGSTTSDGTYSDLAGAITPTFADFTAGVATYTFTIPEGGYKFFKATIVP